MGPSNFGDSRISIALARVACSIDSRRREHLALTPVFNGVHVQYSCMHAGSATKS